MQWLYKLAKKPFFGNYMVSWRNPLSETQRLEWKLIRFQSNSRALLSGLVAESKSTVTKGVIVLGHPMGKEAKGYFLKNGYTDLLRENGYHVLIFDLNGFGESQTGNFDYFEDIISAGYEAKRRYPEYPLGYFGISMGGQFATIAFAEGHPFEFAIVESAANTLEDFWIHYPFAHKALKLLYLLMPRYQKRIRMIDRIKKANGLRKLLLIYIENDAVILDDAGKKFKEACPLPTELVIFKNAKHAELAKSIHRDSYFKVILDHFNANSNLVVQCRN
ncbi:alpha/beta hydrolase [Flavobacteriaceae bacterium TP-CH-4]|uniref:Alpha/beta hydrolase n=1 Tax=Pelagihabitans pacificus TaxID=2696054 RepID=A0A967ARX1_9FLAO|nr:alpha/beta hydrolase [Pelagihabitans pacificus]NHF59241.1 alpha/beta hydrolase [Pelagihabitans pacificus]